ASHRLLAARAAHVEPAAERELLGLGRDLQGCELGAGIAGNGDGVSLGGTREQVAVVELASEHFDALSVAPGDLDPLVHPEVLVASILENEYELAPIHGSTCALP